MRRAVRVSKTLSSRAVASDIASHRQPGVRVAALFVSAALSSCTSLLGDFRVLSDEASAALEDASAGTSDADTPEAAADMDASCTTGDTFCATDSPKVRYVCNANRALVKETCAFTCSNGQCDECMNDTFKCTGDVPTTCTKGHWGAPGTACPGKCTPTGCVPCTTGDTRCGTGGLQVCMAGSWAPPVACKYVCGTMNGAAACTGDCNPAVDTPKCNGAQPQACVNGTWTNQGPACMTPLSCSAGNCVTECVSGAKQCLNDTAQDCIGGQWVSEPGVCPNVCLDGEGCTGVCKPGDTMCLGTQTLKTCQADGTYGPPVACPSLCGRIGDKDICYGDCKSGDLRCNQLDVQQCNMNGVWARQSTCVSACFQGNCVDCTPGSKRCSMNNAQICNASGTWVTSTCPYGCNATTSSCSLAPG